jgi:hypothetical protein
VLQVARKKDFKYSTLGWNAQTIDLFQSATKLPRITFPMVDVVTPHVVRIAPSFHHKLSALKAQRY